MKLQIIAALLGGVAGGALVYWQHRRRQFRDRMLNRFGVVHEIIDRELKNSWRARTFSFKDFPPQK